MIRYRNHFINSYDLIVGNYAHFMLSWVRDLISPVSIFQHKFSHQELSHSSQEHTENNLVFRNKLHIPIYSFGICYLVSMLNFPNLRN